MACVIQIRNDSSANWASVNPVLAIGELAISNDLSNFKIGDGVSNWSSLSYIIQSGLTTENVQDIIGSLMVDSSSIDFTYDDNANTLTAAAIPSGINHDNLLNMSANKHIDHTLVSIMAGTGLSGGGDLTATRTLSLANTAVTPGTYNNSATQTQSFTVDAQGRLTATGSLVTITPAWGSITGKPTTLSGYGITDGQPLDADLTAIAALSGTSGLLRKTALDTWALDTNTYLTANQSITLSGDVTGTGTTAITTTLANTAVTVGSYGSASQVASFTVDSKGRLTAASNTAISITSTSVSDFTEAVQDVMGAILADTNTIDFTYNDASNTIATDVRLQMSITSDANGLKLVNDVSSPGNLMVYGTDASGVKGWYGVPSPEGSQTLHGFVVPYEITMSYNATTRQVTITPTGASFTIWVNGTKFIKSGSQISPAHTNATNTYYIYYDSSGVLTVSTSPWTIDSYGGIPVCAVYYNATLVDGIVLFEAHSAYRNPELHSVIHTLNGAFIQSPTQFALTGYTLSTATDAAVTYAIASGVVCDEDIEWNISAVADNGPYFIAYRTGATAWAWYTGNAVPYLFNKGNSNNIIQYNQNNAGSYQLTDLTDLNYVNYYLFAITELSASKRLVLIPGHQIHSTLSSARSEEISSLDTTNLPVNEMAPLYKLTYKYSSANGNSGRATLENVLRYYRSYQQIVTAPYYRDDANIDIASPYVINFGSNQRESIILNETYSEDPYWSNVVALLKFDAADGTTNFIDSSNYSNVFQAVDNAQISTAQSKFGGSSLYCDGTGDYIRSLSTSAFSIPTNGDYTIEGWFYSTASGIRAMITWGASPYWNIWKNASDFLVFFGNGADRITGAVAITNNTWHHIAVSRASGVYRLFLNGVVQGTNWSDTTAVPPAEFWIGGWPGGGSQWSGYIDEVRFTNGTARYTGAFTPPTVPFGVGGQYYAIGSQLNTMYFRSSAGFSWYKGGIFASDQGDPGLNGVQQMHLSTAGTLFVPGLMRVGSLQGVDVSSMLFEATESLDSYIQCNIRNMSSGTSATSDWVATNDTGTDTTGYIDLGINSSTYSVAEYNSGGPGDGYLMVAGGALALITTDSFEIGFFTNGATTNQRRLTIYPTGNVVVGLGALPTNATTGFLYHTTSPGAPTGTPTSYSGSIPLTFDSTNDDVYWYNSVWRTITPPILAGGYVSGNYYDNSMFGVASTTLVAAANQLTVMPFTTRKDATINLVGVVGVNVTAGVSGNVIIVIYASDPTTGWPTTRLAISDNIALAATGFQSIALSFTFRKGVRYWIGVHTSAAPTLSAIPVANMQSLGLTASNATSHYTVLRQTVAFGSSPNPWTFAAAQLTSSVGYSIRFRIA